MVEVEDVVGVVGVDEKSTPFYRAAKHVDGTSSSSYLDLYCIGVREGKDEGGH